MTWLRVHSDPLRHYYRDARVLDVIPAGQARHQLLTAVGQLTSEVGGENSNVSITLKDSTEAHTLMAVPPLGCTASLLDETGEIVFTAVVTSVRLGPGGCEIGLEA